MFLKFPSKIRKISLGSIKISRKLTKLLYEVGSSQVKFANFCKEFLTYKSLAGKTKERFTLMWKNRYPCLNDKTLTTGFEPHYVYHTAWAARIIANTKPEKHVDISSYLYFSTLISAFIPVKFYDYRPAELVLSGLETGQADLCSLPFEDCSIKSLSCMHVVEHVGLGRYGDILDPDGDLKAISELKRVLALGGSLLFVVPVGKPVIQFNAHRIYSYDQIMEYFVGLELQQFSLIPDNHEGGGFVYNATREMANQQNWGCGCFWLKKTTLQRGVKNAWQIKE